MGVTSVRIQFELKLRTWYLVLILHGSEHSSIYFRIGEGLFFSNYIRTRSRHLMTIRDTLSFLCLFLNLSPASDKNRFRSMQEIFTGRSLFSLYLFTKVMQMRRVGRNNNLPPHFAYIIVISKRSFIE